MMDFEQGKSEPHVVIGYSEGFFAVPLRRCMMSHDGQDFPTGHGRLRSGATFEDELYDAAVAEAYTRRTEVAELERMLELEDRRDHV